MASEKLHSYFGDGTTADPQTPVIDPSTPLPLRCLTFRLSEIPLDMDARVLCQCLDSLKVGTASIKGNSRVFSIAKYESWQVATVSFHHLPDEFEKCKPRHQRLLYLKKRQIATAMSHGNSDRHNRYKPDHGVYSRLTEGEFEIRAVPVRVTIDCDFFSMTPLYQPVGTTAEYDIIAVTGLSAHAFGSWKSPDEADTMWLRDFLPRDFSKSRVYTWGYYSSIMDDRRSTTITAISRRFLEDIKRVRETQTVSRPLILIGHSLGGLVIQEALVAASKGNCEKDKAVHQSCIGVLFFGVPIRGLNRTSIESLVKGKQNDYFLQTISSGSDYLFDLENNFRICYRSMKSCTVVSFYESVDTLTIEKSPGGKFKRSGPPIRMVPRESAVCSISEDHNIIEIREDHSKMVKFRSKSDEHYVRVITKIQEIASAYQRQSVQERIQDSQIQHDTVSHIEPRLNDIQRWLEDCDRYSILQWISAIPYRSHHQRISEGRLEGTGKWLFERQEYKDWISSDVSNLLLLRGIPGAGKTYIT
ncbi:hypothetical protein BZA77DRAFT_343298 [Pyronema omphalodes]|nr:hypothetical protein BZA77DRAFT_343298 [Pyronema omphalodes]